MAISVEVFDSRLNQLGEGPTSSGAGNNDVYLMPINGGDIKQLTFHDGADVVSSWSWDSSKIYFTSGRYNSFTTYSVN